MFEEIRKCLDEYEEVCNRPHVYYNPTEEEVNVMDYFELHLAEAILKDSRYNNNGEKLAKIILATLGMSNEIKIKIE